MTDTTHPPYSQVSPGMARASIPSAAPAAGQAGLAKLVRYHHNEHSKNMHDDPCGEFYKVEDVEAFFATLAAPVAADTEQANDYALLAECSAVFDLMLDGCNEQKFGDYQNGHGEEIGPRMDALHAKLRALATPADAGAGEALTKERITGIGLSLRMQAFENAAYRADIGSKMTAPEQDEFNQQIRFAREVEREVLARISTPGAQVTAPKINTPEFHDLLGRYMRRPSNDTAGDIVAHVQKRFDAYAKGVFAATEYLRDELIKARAAVGSPAPVTAEPAQSIDTPEFRALLDAYACASPVFKTGTVSPIDAARAAILAYLATPVPADRDAIRDQALEDAAGVVLKLTAVPRDVLGPATAQMKALAANGEKLADRIRALKSMERAADAIQDQTLEYRTCCDYPGCVTCNGFGRFYRKRAADAAETRDVKGDAA